ncbi:MAG: hypothetical protein HC830_03365 [Bacteroidetes bacterium]|nr:hypothetical protein [Bacteroidota bacterium]
MFLFFADFQTISLIFFLNRINHDLANFLVYLQENDTTLTFSRNRVENNFRNLFGSLNEINTKIREARVAKEQHHWYLQAVLEHLEVGIISYKSNGSIDLFNKASLNMLGLTSLTNIHQLITKIPELTGLLEKKTTVGERLVKLQSAGSALELAVKLKKMAIGNEQIHILSFQNIQPELEEKELESWKKLIRVLRHEIMNSITPVTTLTTAIRRCFSQNSQRKPLHEITETNIEDALTSAEVIEERSKGLISFVERFRHITDIPAPAIHPFHVKNMFEKVIHLLRVPIQEKNAAIHIQLEENCLQLKADEHLVEQVMINLVKNAIEAIDPSGEIVLKAFRKDQEISAIQVTDNGKGIPEGDIENIFIPSFTTKENGMGVGLSISKQIMHLHHGQITVQSHPKSGTTFELNFTDRT